MSDDEAFDPSATMEITTLTGLDLDTDDQIGSLLVIEGSQADIGLHTQVTSPLVLGRSEDVSMPLLDSRTSRRHAEIAPVPGPKGTAFVIRDLGSRNGTRLNGQRVVGERVLQDGDKISVGNTVLRFSLVGRMEARVHDKLGSLVSVDELTGLPAKHRWDAAFKEAIESAGRSGQPLGVVMADMDGLKAINDAHGHLHGANCISEVGGIIGRVVENAGLASRFGGDEFMFFLESRDAAGTAALCENIRAAVEAHRFEKNGVVVQPTISIGYTVYTGGETSPEGLIAVADAALYRAKEGGRNRVSA